MDPSPDEAHPLSPVDRPEASPSGGKAPHAGRRNEIGELGNISPLGREFRTLSSAEHLEQEQLDARVAEMALRVRAMRAEFRRRLTEIDRAGETPSEPRA